jgi:hypothetical protein
MPKKTNAQAVKKAVKKQLQKAEKNVVNNLKGTKLSGHGNYVTDALTKVAEVANYAPTSTVGKLAKSGTEALASSLGIPGGSMLGNAASWLTKLFGFGSYSTFNHSTLRKNSFLKGNALRAMGDSGFVTNGPPTFSSTSTGSDIVFTHREFVGDILSSINFTKKTYAINAANPVMFPWMSQIARLYEEFSFEGLVMEYKPTSATAVGTTSSAMGVVIQATDYDAEDDNFVNKISMENAEYATSGLPYEHVMHPIECARKRNVLGNLYTQPGITDATDVVGDPRFSFLGNYTIATEGQQADGTRIGELWVVYHVRFSRPMLETSSIRAFTQHLGGQSINNGAPTFVINTLPDSGFTAVPGTNTWDIKIQKSPKVPPGTYLFVMMAGCDNPNTDAFTTPVWSTSAGVPQFYSDGNTKATHGFGVTADATETPGTWAVTSIIGLMDSNSDYISMQVTHDATEIWWWDVYITAYDPNFNLALEKKIAKQRNSRTDINLVQQMIESAMAQARVMTDKDKEADFVKKQRLRAIPAPVDTSSAAARFPPPKMFARQTRDAASDEAEILEPHELTNSDDWVEFRRWKASNEQSSTATKSAAAIPVRGNT